MTVIPQSSRLARSRAVSWPWSYAGVATGERDLRLDLLRGYCLFAMTIDHVAGPQSWLYRVSAAWAIQLVSAAECFVFISGVVAGLVYQGVIAAEGLRGATVRIFKRIGKLYGVVVGLTLFYLALGYLFPTFFGDYWSDNPLETLVGALTLRYDPTGLFAMYILFLALVPLLFFAIGEGKTWLVLVCSALVWVGNLAFPHYFETPFSLYFRFGSWQFIFVTGLVLGYHRAKLLELVRRWCPVYTGYAVLITLLALALLRFNGAVQAGSWDGALPGLSGPLPAPVYQEGGLSEALYDNVRLPPARMFTAFVYIQVFLLLVHYCYQPLRAALGWLLLPLGQASMYVYTMHLLVVYLLLPLIPGFFAIPEPFYGFALFGVVLTLWAMVKTRFLFFLIPR